VAATLQAKGVKTRALLYTDFGLKVPGYYLVASDKLINSKPDLVKRFVAASQKSINATLAHPKAAIDSFIQKYPDYNKKQATGELKLALPLIKSSKSASPARTGRIAIGDAQATLTALRKVGAVKHAKAASDYVTNQYLPTK
jgi:NitT/TauT family transport system substrate-binding protein